MKADTKQIKWLLEHATGYQIAKLSGVPQPTISGLMTGSRKIENLTIITGFKLTKAAEYMQKRTLKNNEELIRDVTDDIALFSEDFEVYAVKIQDDFIWDYVDATEPRPEEFTDKQDFEEVMNNFKGNLKTLEDETYEKMTLAELLNKLEKQRQFFDK